MICLAIISYLFTTFTYHLPIIPLFNQHQFIYHLYLPTWYLCLLSTSPISSITDLIYLSIIIIRLSPIYHLYQLFIIYLFLTSIYLFLSIIGSIYCLKWDRMDKKRRHLHECASVDRNRSFLEPPKLFPSLRTCPILSAFAPLFILSLTGFLWVWKSRSVNDHIMTWTSGSTSDPAC
jgi:hypothetical protein